MMVRGGGWCNGQRPQQQLWQRHTKTTTPMDAPRQGVRVLWRTQHFHSWLRTLLLSTVGHA